MNTTNGSPRIQHSYGRFGIRLAAGLLLLLWLAVASCGQDDVPASSASPLPPPTEELVPLGIATSLDAGLAAEVKTDTRATPVTGGDMNVITYRASSQIGKKYAYASGTWTATNNDPILLGGEGVPVLGIYPQQNYLTNPTDTRIVGFPAFREYNTADDIRYGFQSDVYNVYPVISLNLNHLYARIKMKVSFSDGDTGSGKLEKIKLAFDTDLTAGQYISTAGVNITDGTLSAGASPMGGSYTLSNISYTLSSSNPTYEGFDMLCCSFDGWKLNNGAPGNNVTDVVITVTCDGVDYQVKIAASTFKSGGLLAGKQYMVTLKLLRGVEVIADKITVNEWGATSDAGSTGENQVVAP